MNQKKLPGTGTGQTPFERFRALVKGLAAVPRKKLNDLMSNPSSGLLEEIKANAKASSPTEREAYLAGLRHGHEVGRLLATMSDDYPEAKAAKQALQECMAAYLSGQFDVELKLPKPAANRPPIGGT